MNNAYPELPMLPYEPTSVPMTEVVGALAALPEPAEVKRAAYVMFRNESGNGKSGVNNNYVGAQADGARWPEHLTPLFRGVVLKAENTTGRDRLFLAFYDIAGCLAFLCDRVRSRGLYVGGTTHRVLAMAVYGPEQLCRAYQKEWVVGSARAEPTGTELCAFLSMYGAAAGYFPVGEVGAPAAVADAGKVSFAGYAQTLPPRG